MFLQIKCGGNTFRQELSGIVHDLALTDGGGSSGLDDFPDGGEVLRVLSGPQEADGGVQGHGHPPAGAGSHAAGHVAEGEDQSAVGHVQRVHALFGQLHAHHGVVIIHVNQVDAVVLVVAVIAVKLLVPGLLLLLRQMELIISRA